MIREYIIWIGLINIIFVSNSQKLGADGLLVRSAGLLESLLHHEHTSAIPLLYGDFSLNASNALTSELFLDMGVARLCPTHDCNANQLAALASSLSSDYDPRRLEVIIHQHLPIFHTEHCVFCRFLSDGNSYRDCGHPCEKHNVHLRDSSGQDHVVMADMGCRNTVFNSSSQSAVRYLDILRDSNYGVMRVELLDEEDASIPGILEGYRAVLHGITTPEEHWVFLTELRDSTGRQQGVTEGSLVVRSETFALKPTSASIKNGTTMQALS